MADRLGRAAVALVRPSPPRPGAGEVSRRIAPGKVAVLGLVLGLLGASRAEAGSTFLGVAGDFNVYVSGNMTQTGGDAASSVAVGGNLTATNFTIAGTSGDALVVGGNLSYKSAEIQKGNARVGGTVTMGSSDNSALSSGATLYYGSTTGNSFPMFPHFTMTNVANGGISGTFFSGANGTLTHDSTVLSTQTQNGTVTLSGTTLALAGSNANTDYFNVTAAQLQAAKTLTITAPANATVIVNVSGTTDQFGSAGMSLSGVSASDVLFNFYQATSLTLTGVDFEGSILAPYATLNLSNGHTDGNVMAANIGPTSSFEYHDDGLFTGNPHIASVPEPSTLLLSGFGVAGAGLLAWRRRAAARIVPRG